MDERTSFPTGAQLELASLDKTDWNVALDAILRIESRALGVDRASFWSVCDDPPGIACELGYIASADGIERGAILRSADAQSYARELERARVMPMDDVEHDPRTVELLGYCHARRIGAMLDVPVWVDGVLAGVLCHEHVGGPRTWTRAEIEVALAAGSAVSVALEARRRVRAEAGERRARFLAHASHALGRTLDEREVAARAVSLLLPESADWAALDLFDGERIERVAMAHADPARAGDVERYRGVYPPHANAPHVTVLARRLQQAAVVPEVTDERLRGFGFSDEHIAALRRLGLRSIVVVPFANAVVDGVLLLVSSSRSYGADDLALAEDYRDRVCSALSNARLYQRSQAALRARDDFLRMASHELRTPLTALRMSCERLASTAHDVPRELAASAERALRASRRLSRLVSHMLDAVELDGEALVIDRARVDLVPVVRDAVDDLLLTTHTAGVELALPGELVGNFDDERVQEIVANLVDNAVRYGGGQPIRLALAKDGHDAVLSVADHGPGIAPELLPRVFLPYERGPSAQGKGGLGLGLFIVKQLVDAQGGAIDVRSRPGEGAEFIVRLPGVE